MTIDRPYQEWSASALAQELSAREKHKEELTAALERQDDREMRVSLMAELSATNDVLDQLTAEVVERSIPPSVLPTYQSVVMTGNHEPVGQDNPRQYRPDDGRRSAQPPARPDLLDSRRSDPSRRLWPMIFLGAVAVAAIGLVAFLLTRPDADPTDGVASPPVAQDQDSTAAEIAEVVSAVGGPGVVVEQRDSTVFLSGTVGSVEVQQAVIGSAEALAGDLQVDASALTVVDASPDDTTVIAVQGGDSRAFQSEVDRIIAATPIIFGAGETELTELHQRVLNNVAATMAAYPGLPVSVVGYTDDVGSDEANRQLSLVRAENVRSYLVGQGIAEGLLSTEAMGEEASSGSDQLANLERRVEFQVALGTVVGAAPLRLALVAPSDRDDLAFTQSMADAIEVIATERGNLEVAITDNTFVPDEAAAAIRNYAEGGYDLIIAHGSQYGSILLELAPEYPDVAFAWGTASDTFGLSNVYAYDAAAEEGGYVLGALSALLSETGTIGVVGPIEVGDAERYINGFRSGALAERPASSVLVTYTGSFSDTSFARDAATAHIEAGADVLTGSAQMVLGAVAAMSGQDLVWLGNQANQTPLDPGLVGASQVYHWETILRQIVADVDAGRAVGQSYTANLANGGLVIEYNSAVSVPDAVRQRADDLMAAIANGSLTVPG